jgi:hypothetical protein
MSFPRTHRGIKGMIRSALLETSTARDIVRKSGVRPGGTGEAGGDVQVVDLVGQYSKVAFPSAGTHSAIGSTANYVAGVGGVTIFPGIGSLTFEQYGDYQGFAQARLLATITQAADPDCTMFLGLQYYSSVAQVFQEFTPTGPHFGAPMVAIDEVGLHISAWKSFEISSDYNEARGMEWVVGIGNTGGDAGSFGVGLVQLQVREG